MNAAFEAAVCSRLFEFSGPGGEQLIVPGFWDGGNVWRARFAPTSVGLWSWRSQCSDSGDDGLHGLQDRVEAVPWPPAEIEKNPLRRGFVRVHPSGRYFEYADGTPFYWLGDTLWAVYTGHCREDDLALYLSDRKDKGFTVIQVVAGRPAGAMAEGDATDEVKHANEGGLPYIDRYERINPAYFQYFERKIRMILDAGFIPCLNGMWAWDIRMGVPAAKEYWRYLIARYAALNLLWSISGEYFFVPDEEAWREIGREIHRCDPYAHPTSAHSTAPHSGSRHFQGEDWYDFNLVQVGHVLAFRQLFETLPLSDYHARPVKPSIMSESWYENHPNCEGTERRRINDGDVRFAAYTSLLQGCVGQTYGAHGIWSWYGEPGGWSWADDYHRPSPWREDLDLPGSRQMGYLRALMESVGWWKLAPHPEFVTSPQGTHVYCAADPGREYVVYAAGGPADIFVFVPGGAGESYEGRWFDPRTGQWSAVEKHEFFPYGSWWRWTAVTPGAGDWVLILKARVD